VSGIGEIGEIGEIGFGFSAGIWCRWGNLLHAPRAAEDRTGHVMRAHMFGTQTADSQRHGVSRDTDS